MINTYYDLVEAAGIALRAHDMEQLKHLQFVVSRWRPAIPTRERDQMIGFLQALIDEVALAEAKAKVAQ